MGVVHSKAYFLAREPFSILLRKQADCCRHQLGASVNVKSIKLNKMQFETKQAGCLTERCKIQKQQSERNKKLMKTLYESKKAKTNCAAN